MNEYIIIAIILVFIVIYLLVSLYLYNKKSLLNKVEQDKESDANDIRNGYISKADFIKKISSSLTSFFEYQNIIKDLARELCIYFDAGGCCFLDYKEKLKKISPPAESNMYISSSSDVLVPAESDFEKNENFFNKVLQANKPYVIKDVSKFHENNSIKEYFQKLNVGSVLLIPIFYKNIPEGLFALRWSQSKKMDVLIDVEFISVIAAISSVIIHQSKLYANFKKIQSQESLARTIVNKILASKDLKEAVDITLTELSIFLDATRGVFRFYDPQYNFFQEIVSEYSLKGDYIAQELKYSVPKDMNEFYLNSVFKGNDILIIEDVTTFDYPPSFKQRIEVYHKLESMLLLGLRYQNKPLAVIIFDLEGKSVRDRAKINFLSYIKPQLAACMSLYYLNNSYFRVSEIEKSIIKMITKFHQISDTNEVSRFLLPILVEILESHGAVQYILDRNNNIYLKNSYSSNNYESVDIYQNKRYQEQITQYLKSARVVVNDVEEEITDLSFKKSLNEDGVASFALYSKNIKMPEDTYTKETWITVVYNKTPKLWSSEYINALNLVVDTMALLYIDLLHKKEIDDTKQTFIATLTHDLKSPIIAEQKALEMILLANPEKPVGNYFEFLKDIHKTNEDQLKMIMNLLSVYHFERGGYKFNFEANDVEGLLNESLRPLKYIATDRNCEIKHTVESNLPPVNVDREEIRRVFINLINNAIVHTHVGTQISIMITKRDEYYVQVAISDNGEGISELNKSKVFSKFQSTKSKVGAGLGLYLSKQIVESHKGEIWFESVEGEGTTFFFTMPIYRD